MNEVYPAPSIHFSKAKADGRFSKTLFLGSNKQLMGTVREWEKELEIQKFYPKSSSTQPDRHLGKQFWPAFSPSQSVLPFVASERGPDYSRC